MPFKKIFFNSLKQSYSIMKNNLLVILFLFIVQIIFFASVSFVSYSYLPKIVEPIGAINDYLSGLDIDQNVVDNIFNDRIESGQLNNSPLTLSDIDKIKDSFKNILIGQHHKRIRYPNQDEIEKGIDQEIDE